MDDSPKVAFPGAKSGVSFSQDIVYLTRSKKDNPESEFCKELKGRGIRAHDFDAIKDSFCALRDSTGNNCNKLKSVDCVFKSALGECYFIEFKKTTSERLNEIDDGEPIEVSFRKKAFDSILMSSYTLFLDDDAQSIMRNSVLIVVYRPSAKDCLEALEFNKALTECSGDCDSISEKHPIMWGLRKLRDVGLYKDVHTWPENEFVPWAKKYLK